MHEQQQLKEFLQELHMNDYDNYQDVWVFGTTASRRSKLYDMMATPYSTTGSRTTHRLKICVLGTSRDHCYAIVIPDDDLDLHSRVQELRGCVVASIEMTIILFYSWFAALHDACMHAMTCASTDPDFIIGWTAVLDFIIH